MKNEKHLLTPMGEDIFLVQRRISCIYKKFFPVDSDPECHNLVKAIHKRIVHNSV